MKKGNRAASSSQLIDARIKELSDCRGETLAQVRIVIKEADPEVVEEWKWRGVPVWSHAGMICTGETEKNFVKERRETGPLHQCLGAARAEELVFVPKTASPASPCGRYRERARWCAHQEEAAA
jgi:hypothetical protein